MMFETWLLRRAQGGDQRALEALYSRHGGVLALTLRRYGLALDEDARQDANLAFLRAILKFDATRGWRFVTYASRAVEHQLQNTWRLKMKPAVPTEHSEITTVDDGYAAVEDRDTVERLLRRLHSRDKAVLKTYYGIEDGIAHSLAQTGVIHGISDTRVAQILDRSLERMRNE